MHSILWLEGATLLFYVSKATRTAKDVLYKLFLKKKN